ncbi:MAG: efflux RND transporter permease subunit, partial [Acidobacteria bacterium]|nr:efflux RND transporter permease subunit [Acidobacteriota bacterium]
MRLPRIFHPSEGDERNQKAQFWFARLASPIIFLILVLAVAGAYMAFTLPVSVFPTTDFPRVVIGIDNGVMPIDQMLVTITRPLENAVNSVQGLQSVRSITSRGEAEIDLFFDWNVDMFQTLQYVDAAVATIQPELPATARIDSHRLTFASFPIIGYSLTSDTVPQTQLWELATYTIKPRLNRLDGVATVVVQGGQVPEYHIIPDPAKLLAAQVTVSDILDAVRRTNLIDSPGLLPEGHELFLALVNGQARTPEQIGQIVIKTTQAAVPVRIADVASVQPGVQQMYTLVSADGKPAVLLNINRQPYSNTVAVAQEAHDEVEKLRQSLPPGIEIKPFYDQSIIVNASIKSVRDAILIGLILASTIMVLFLRDWGTSIVAGLVIPVTIAVTLIILRMLGQSFNLMTLGGLAAAVGLVIDDAIVVVENIVLHRDAGQPRLQAIHTALAEITVPLIGSTVTPIVVLLPLVSMVGVYGVFFRALAVTVGAALLTSLALALTWTPNLSQFFISPSPRRPPAGAETLAEAAGSQQGGSEVERLMAAEEAGMQGFFGRVVRVYERALRFSLERPLWIGLGSVILIAVAFLTYKGLGQDLLPPMDEGGFILDYWMPAGSSLQETARVLTHVDQILLTEPEVASITRRTGLELGLSAVTEAHRGDFTVKLKEDKSRPTDDVMDEVRKKVQKEEPALRIEVVQLLSDMINDLQTNEPAPIQIELFSEDQTQLAEWAPKVADAIKKVEGPADVLNGIENTISGPAITFTVNPTTTARAGFTPEEVATDASAILEGEPAPTPVINNDRTYTIRVRFPQQNRSSLADMQNTLISSSSGHTATLGSLATIAESPGQMEIRRENLQRDITVTAELEKRDLGGTVTDIQKAIADLHLPSNIRVEYAGAYAQQQSSFRELVTVTVLAVVLVFLVLLFEFRNFAAPVAILASALLSVSGVFFALLVTRTTFNISSFMGVIMTIGIVAKNGILLLDADEKFRSWGFTPEEAMIQAGRRRLRPIVMTALATVAGMLPLAFGIGAGSQMLQPLAIAVIGGILISMVLSLVITPTTYFRLTRA